MIRTILIDDEPDAREALRLLIQRYCSNLTIVGEASSAQEGKMVIEAQSPELVFLDIQMPQQSGFDLLNSLSEINFRVIFVTAFDQYAIKAIRFNALDYLLKPIDLDDLQMAIRRFEKTRGAEDVKSRYQALVYNYQHGKRSFQKLAVPVPGGTTFIPLGKILFAEAEGSYTRIHRQEDDALLLSKPLKEVEQLLDGNIFFRVHHSFLINLDHIERYVRADGGYVTLKGNYNIPVSRRRKEDFLKCLGLG